MKRFVITGFSGFVARYFVDYLYNERIQCEVLGLSRTTPLFDYSRYSDRISVSFRMIDLVDKEALRNALRDFKPDYVLHLAAFSSVAYSWKHPTESFTNNSNLFLNLIDVIRETSPSCRVLSVGSSEEYGNVSKENLPIRENQVLEPLSPYAVARVSQELMSRVYVNAFGMNIIMTRSFNHIGPGQDNRFVVPSFIDRIVKIKELGLLNGEIETGDISIIRDFVDVRDVVRAYYLLLERGKTGEVYNVCSGKAYKLSEIVDYISKIVGVEVAITVNPDYIRPNDNREIVGSHYKISAELGWEPLINYKDSIRDMISFREENNNDKY